MEASSHLTGSMKFSMMLLAVALGLIVQIQITPEFGDTKVRLNLADPLVAGLVPLMFYVAVRNRYAIIDGIGWRVLALFAFATAVFSYAYAVGFSKIGFFAWSAVKYAGWYALMAYFAVGVFIAALLGRTGQKAFVIAFVGAVGLLVMLQILSLLFKVNGIYLAAGLRFQGFAGNPNAFGFVLVCGLALCAAYREEINSTIAAGAAKVLSSLILVGIYYTGSIGAFLASLLVLGFSLMGIMPWKRLALILILALVLIGALKVSGVVTPNSGRAVLENKIAFNWKGASGNDSHGIYYSTIGARIDAMQQGIELWRQSPVFGAGLGVHLFQQKNKADSGQKVVSIHNTGLWLLVETGLVGLFTFVLLFMMLVRNMWRNTKAGDKAGPVLPPGNFASAALICLLAWLLMSLFHELMYQRVIWLIAGMAMWTTGEDLRKSN